jgi:uncharacterized protein YndB with AHSA1/START domain
VAPMILHTSIEIDAPAPKVWEVLTAPDLTVKWIRKWWPELKRLESTWEVDSLVEWRLADGTIGARGKVTKAEPHSELRYTFKIQDRGTSHEDVLYTLEEKEGRTRLPVTIVDFGDSPEHEVCYPGAVESWNRSLPKIRELAETERLVGERGFIAWADVDIRASIYRVWDALMNPAIIRQYMFGTRVISGWEEGDPIVWTGEWEGKRYQDRGMILRLDPGFLIRYSHYSPLSGLPDTPDHYHAVTVRLTSKGDFTRVSLSQDNNPTERASDHSRKNWETMLENLKRLLEEDPLQRLFSGYEKAFSSLDTRRNAEYFSDIFISAGPRGAIAQSKAEFLRLADQAAEFYRSVGQTSASILSMQETPVSDQYSMIKVHRGVTFLKTGDRMIEFDVSYLVQKTGPEPEILLFIAHQDEEEAMRKLGIVSEKS